MASIFLLHTDSPGGDNDVGTHHSCFVLQSLACVSVSIFVFD